MKTNDNTLKSKQTAVNDIKYTNMKGFEYGLSVDYPIESSIEYIVKMQIINPDHKTSKDSLATKQMSLKSGTVAKWNIGLKPLRIIMYLYNNYETKLYNELRNYNSNQVKRFKEKLIGETDKSCDISDTLKEEIKNNLEKIYQNYLQDTNQSSLINETPDKYKEYARSLKNMGVVDAVITNNLAKVCEYFKDDEDELAKFLKVTGLA